MEDAVQLKLDPIKGFPVNSCSSGTKLIYCFFLKWVKYQRTDVVGLERTKSKLQFPLGIKL